MTEDPIKPSASALSNDTAPKKKEHEGFSSRFAFLMTAVGCAVGFGNVWRFPYLVYKHGGLAFMIVYFVILVIVVTPTCVLEMGLGQISRGGQIQAWSKLGRRARAPGIVGWVAFSICTYYPVLLVWSLMYFANSWKSPMPWTSTEEHNEICKFPTTQKQCESLEFCKWKGTGADAVCFADPLYSARLFFRDQVYAHSDFAGRDRNIKLTGISGWGVLCLFISWTLNILSLIAGAKVLGYIMYVTMTLPVIFLIVLVGMGVALEGAGDGIRAYIAKFDVKKFTVESWVDAVGQGVFSVGVGQGTFAAFTAHNNEGQNFVVDGIVIILADTIYAFVAGFAVFAVIGYLALQSGETTETLPIDGISLAFMTYPVGLSHINNYMANILAALFFATLWLIGMDTLVGLVEALVLMLCNSRTGVRWGIKRWHATVGLSVFFFLVPGLLTVTNLGFALLDVLDSNSALAQAFGAGVQCAVAGWAYLYPQVHEKIGPKALWVHGITLLIGAFVLGLVTTVSNVAAGIAVGFGLPIIGFLVSVFFLANKQDERGNELSVTDRIYYLTTYNLEPLRKLFNDSGCGNSFWHVPRIWNYMVKYVVPYVVMYLTISGLATPAKMYSRPTADAPYPWYIFLIGQISPFFMVLCIFLFLIAPDTMLPLLPPLKEGREPTLLAEAIVPLCDRKPGVIPFDPEKGGAETGAHGIEKSGTH